MKYQTLIAFLPFMLICNFLHAQHAETEAQINKLEQQVVNAILNNDTVSLKNLWAPEFMVNNPRNNISANRAAVFATQKAGLIDYSRFERKVEQMLFENGVVITMGYEWFIPRNDQPGLKAGNSYKRRFTNVWMQRDNSWQQVARHASIICE